MHKLLPLVFQRPNNLDMVIRRSHPLRCLTAGCSAKEAEMELRVSLNAIAALTSFAFLAAIVLGVV